MAYPVIQTTNVTDTAAGTSHVMNMPSGITAGDLLLVFFATDGDNTITNWGGFTELDQQDDGKNVFGAVGYKIAVGSDTLTITTSVSEPSSAIMYRIDGWNSSYAPEIPTYVYGTDDSPDPAILTPSWSTGDTLWIAMCAYDANRTVTGYPSNYTLNQLNQQGGGNGDCGVGVGARNRNWANENPTVFTLSGADQWYAWTIGVAPISTTTAYKDITLKTSLTSALTYKDIALKTTLESIPIYKDITLKTSFSAAPLLAYKDITLKTSLSSPDYRIESGTGLNFGRGEGKNRVIYQQERGSNNYYYSLYVDDNDDLILEYSTDGLKWDNTPQNIYTGTVGDYDVKFYDSGSDTKFFVVLYDTVADDLTYIRGSLTDSGTTPTWDSAQDIDSSITHILSGSHSVAIIRNYNGRLVVAFTEDYNDTEDYRQTKIIGASDDGAAPSWSNETTIDDPSGSTNNDGKDGVFVGIESYSSSYPNRVAIHARIPYSDSAVNYTTKIWAYDWNGSLMSEIDSAVKPAGSTYDDPTALIIDNSDYVHWLIKRDESSQWLEHHKYDTPGEVGSTLGDTEITSTAVDAATLTLDRTNNEIYVFYHHSADSTTYHYRKSDTGTINFGTEQDITAEDAPTVLSSWNSDVKNHLHLAYIDNDGDIYYDSLGIEPIVYKDIALKTTLESALTYKDITLKTSLHSLDYKDISLKTSLESAPTYKDISLKTTLESNFTYKDVAIKTSLESISTYKDITLKTSLHSLDFKDITLKTTLESALVYKDISIKTSFTAPATYKDIALKTTLESALTYKDITLKTTLESIPIYKDITLKTTLDLLNYKDVAIKTSLYSEQLTAYKDITLKTSIESALTYKDIAVKTSLDILDFKDIAVKTSLHSLDYKDIALKTSLDLLTYKDVAIKISLEAVGETTAYKDITLKTTLESAITYKDITLKTTLDSLDFKDITLKTSLESNLTYKDISLKVSLESAIIYKDISLKTSLDSLNYKDITLKTSLEGIGYKDITIKTSLELYSIPTDYKDITIKVSLEAIPSEIRDFTSSITQVVDFTSSITQVVDFTSSITRLRDFTSNN